MTAKDRVALISGLAEKNRRVQVAELSEICDVTEETIRKDLNKLEAAGVLMRVHGGAVWKGRLSDLNDTPSEETNQGFSSHFLQRRDQNAEEKRLIAKHIPGLLRNANTLFVDSSTTVAEALSVLPENMDLTLVTNSIYIFSAGLSPSMNIISTGGDYNSKYLSLQGTVAKECVNKYNVDAALISCKALDMDRGVQDSNEGEAEIKKIMIERSRKVILLVDHTKFERTAFVKLMNLDSVDYIVTDREPADAWKQLCEKNDIQLIY